MKIIKWSNDCFPVAGDAANQKPKFKKSNTKIYVAVVTLSTQNNVKLLKQLESRFKRTIIWNRYYSETTKQAQNKYLDFLIDPTFPGENIFFVFSFKDEDDRESYKQYNLPNVEKKIIILLSTEEISLSANKK